MASYTQTPPNLQLVEKGLSQEGLARDDQSPTNLQVPDNQPRKRRSTDAIREQSQPRKYGIRPAIDFGKHKIMIEPGGDGDEIAIEDVQVAIARIKLERIERGKARGYVQNEIEVSDPVKGRLCTCCGNPVRWQGKCNGCIWAECFRWLEGILPDAEPDGGIKSDEGDIKPANE